MRDWTRFLRYWIRKYCDSPVHTLSNSLRIYFCFSLESGFIFFRIRCRIVDKAKVTAAQSSSVVLRLLNSFKESPGRFIHSEKAWVASLNAFFISYFLFANICLLTGWNLGLNTNTDCILLSGVLAVKTFQVTFLGSGVGVDYRNF